jgi:hypothetical protein
MKVTFWIQTNKIGSRCESVQDIPDEDLEGLSRQERDKYLEEWGKDTIWNMAEWGWNDEES